FPLSSRNILSSRRSLRRLVPDCSVHRRSRSPDSFHSHARRAEEGRNPTGAETSITSRSNASVIAARNDWCAGQRNSLSGTRLVWIRMRSLSVQYFSSEELRRSTRIHVSSYGGCRNRRIGAVKDR